MSDSELARESLLQAALRKLDLVDRAEVVAWASSYVEGCASDVGLDELAALASANLEGVDSLLECLLRRFGEGEPSEFESGMLAAASVARELGQGSLQPIEAARSIWRIARRAPASEGSLRVFIGLASEWEDDFDHRGTYEEEIRSAALMIEGWRP